MKEDEENDMTGYLTKLKEEMEARLGCGRYEVANGDAAERRSAYAILLRRGYGGQAATADRYD